MTEAGDSSRRYAWYVVFVLILAYTISYVDRTILTLLVAPIRKAFGISDVQLSLLHGFAFAIFYTVLGIPIGRLVDSRRRTGVIAVGIAVWSVMTALCGVTRTFGQMFAARIGVGVGEAALSPAAYSMLSDYFAGKHLARALSFYSGSIYVGAGLATIAGGTLIALVPPIETALTGPLAAWQVVFIAVGLPGLLVAILVATLREPVRTGLTRNESATPPSLREVARYLWQRRGAFGLMILGFSIASTMWNGMVAWIPSHFIRNFGWTPAQVGVRYGSAMLVFGTAGILTGGWISGAMRGRGRSDANVRIGILSALLAWPAGVAAPLVPNAGLALGCMCLFLFCGAMPYGGAAAALQEITPNRMRGQVSALYLFGINIAGIGFGPTLVALLTEHVYGGDAMVGRAIATTVAVTAPLSALVLLWCCASYRRTIGAGVAAPI